MRIPDLIILFAAIAPLLSSAAALAADPPRPAVSAKTADLELSARLILERDAQLRAVGSHLNRQYVIVELTVTPRGGYPLVLSRDDFLLRSERDNERGTADSPERIAGAAVLVLGSSRSGPGFHTESGDPIYVGGLPGTADPPRRVGAVENTFGAGGGGETRLSSSQTRQTPLLDKLREKELPLGETRKPVSGYLYFPVDPQQKLKNFHLHYKGPQESVDLRFR